VETNPLLEREREVAALHDAPSARPRGGGACSCSRVRGHRQDAAPARARRRRRTQAGLQAGERPGDRVRGAHPVRPSSAAARREGPRRRGRARAELFEGAARLARTVFGATDDEGADRYSQLNGLFWLLSSIAREAPLAVVADDLQWADEPSLEFLTFLSRRIESLPILLVAATRPAVESGRPHVRALVLDPSATLLRPAALGLSSVEVLVRDALGTDAAQEFDAACMHATRGNPLLLKELLRDVRSRSSRRPRPPPRRSGPFAPRASPPSSTSASRVCPRVRARWRRPSRLLGDGQPGGDRRPRWPHAAGDDRRGRGRTRPRRRPRGPGRPLLHAPARARGGPARHPAQPHAALHEAAARALRARGVDPVTLAGHLLHAEPAGDPRWSPPSSRPPAARRARSAGHRAGYLARALAEPPAARAPLAAAQRPRAGGGTGGHRRAGPAPRRGGGARAQPAERASASLELALA
jgi:hypothetical protein